MTTKTDKTSKIVNPQLSLGLLNTAQPHGAFEIYVRLAEPSQIPAYLTVTGKAGSGFLKATIPSNKIARLSHDDNVVDIELREFNSQSDSTLVQ